MSEEFMFATGIECSYPTIHNGTWRFDAMEACDHYKRWEEDLELVTKIGIKFLRYGPPLHRVFLGPNKYNWDFLDQVCAGMQMRGITPILDLCHFGVPDWLENFQNPEFPKRMAEYAGAVARRYPWIRMYTPVNEMYVTTRNSALYGMWNEQLESETAYVTATKHVVQASILMTHSILNEIPDAVMLTSESSEFNQSCCPDESVVKIADFENQRRFIALDLLYGVRPREDICTYLEENGITSDELNWMLEQSPGDRTILGIDYYEWNEVLIDENGKRLSLGELFGWYVITAQYFDRYKRVMMHSETNHPDPKKAPAWLWRQWHNVELMRTSGIPVVGFTWYSLTDQIDWGQGMTQALGNVYPVGLADLNRTPRAVGLAYENLINMYRGIAKPNFDLQSDHYDLRQKAAMR
jgi:beta-glucosidase/6-phospho-beta-glucosidase/beta-galactosidase